VRPRTEPLGDLYGPLGYQTTFVTHALLHGKR
jgi:hypothetical protein